MQVAGHSQRPRRGQRWPTLGLDGMRETPHLPHHVPVVNQCEDGAEADRSVSAFPFRGEAARSAPAVPIRIIIVRGGLGRAKGRMERQGARGKFRNIFVVKGNLFGGAGTQREQTHILIVSRHLRAQPATASLVNISRRNPPGKVEVPIHNRGDSRKGTSNHSFHSMRRIQIMRRNSTGSADFEDEGYSG